MPGPPPGPGFPPPRAGGSRPLIIAVVAAVAAAVLLIAGVAGFLLLRDDDSGAAAKGPVDLREPLLFHEVGTVAAPPCAAGAVADVENAHCYLLAPAAITARRLENLQVLGPDPAKGQPGWRLAVTLTRADAAAFAGLTERAAARPVGDAGRQIAMVSGGRVLSAPSVNGPISGGALEISGPATFTRTYLTDLAARMTGRRRS